MIELTARAMVQARYAPMFNSMISGGIAPAGVRLYPFVNLREKLLMGRRTLSRPARKSWRFREADKRTAR